MPRKIKNKTMRHLARKYEMNSYDTDDSYFSATGKPNSDDSFYSVSSTSSSRSKATANAKAKAKAKAKARAKAKANANATITIRNRNRNRSRNSSANSLEARIRMLPSRKNRSL
jgi:hypothetical protein